MYLIEFGKRIKDRRIELRMTQDQLAEKCGYSSRTTIVKIEKGEIDVPQSKIEILANALRVKPSFLMGWNEPQKCDNFSFSSPNVVEFNVCGSVKAGYGGECSVEYTTEKVQIPTIKLKGHDVSEFFVLSVRGDSMYPKILDGDKVLVLKTDVIDSGKIGVMLFGENEASVKKIHIETNKYILEPINPNYPPITIAGDDLTSCRVLGEVISLIRDF